MSYNDENATRIVFDIETFPLDEAASFLEPAVVAPANYKDPQKIAEYIAERTASQVDRAALDLDLCRVVAIGLQGEGDAEPIVRLGLDTDERELLTWFWGVGGVCHLIGFNVLGFDLPVLLRRSLYLGVRAPRIYIDRFKHPQVTDLMQELAFGRTEFVRGLGFYSRRFGFPVVDTMTGADIGAAIKAGEWDRVRAHVCADVQKTMLLAEKIGVFRRG